MIKCTGIPESIYRITVINICHTAHFSPVPQWCGRGVFPFIKAEIT